MLVPKTDLTVANSTTTLWVDAVMFVDTQLVIAEDSMEARGMSAILSQLWPQFGQILGQLQLTLFAQPTRSFALL